MQIAADQFEFDMEAGPEIHLMFLSPQGWQAELRYFGVASWESIIDLLYAAPSPVGQLLFDGQGQSALVRNPLLGCESELYSTEFNFRRPIAPWLTPMIGFRWVELQEAYAAAALERPAVVADVDRLHVVAYETHNHLYGLQCGADLSLLNRGGPLRINSSIKGGVYFNDADLVAARESFTIASGPDGAIVETESFREAVDEESHVSFLSEITFGATWQVRNWLAFRGGWQLLWLEGVAMAPEQLATTVLGDPRMDGSPSEARANTDGSTFYHGPYASIEVVW
ncbi:MAG: hypothetical protein HUU20_04825 [Pirellulales bacterium]|nr:hypothetical protein [Pirellulales bacterium]